VIATICFAVVYSLADQSPQAPSGDTAFAWMPLLYVLFVGPAWLLIALIGLISILVWRPPEASGRWTARAVVVGCILAVVFVFLGLPSWGGPEGFPVDGSVRGAAVLGALVSVVPAALLARWLARHPSEPSA
jgi:hypothetical protein